MKSNFICCTLLSKWNMLRLCSRNGQQLPKMHRKKRTIWNGIRFEEKCAVHETIDFWQKTIGSIKKPKKKNKYAHKIIISNDNKWAGERNEKKVKRIATYLSFHRCRRLHRAFHFWDVFVCGYFCIYSNALSIYHLHKTMKRKRLNEREQHIGSNEMKKEVKSSSSSSSTKHQPNIKKIRLYIY